jgi:hypothetical protein
MLISRESIGSVAYRERGRGVLAAAAWRPYRGERPAKENKPSTKVLEEERSFCPLDCRTRFGH